MSLRPSAPSSLASERTTKHSRPSRLHDWIETSRGFSIDPLTDANAIRCDVGDHATNEVGPIARIRWRSSPPGPIIQISLSPGPPTNAIRVPSGETATPYRGVAFRSVRVLPSNVDMLQSL